MATPDVEGPCHPSPAGCDGGAVGSDGHARREGDLYGDAHVAFLEKVRGPDHLSPGGAAEIARVLEGLDLAGRTAVGIGCGPGGITEALVRAFGAERVIGFDVEAGVCTSARARAGAEGVADRVDIRRTAPGPMPPEGASADLVFSKDRIVHVADKHALAADVFRVLRPGGWFAASDWLIGHDGPPSPVMAACIAAEDLDVHAASPARYRAAMEAAGVADIRLVERNPCTARRRRASARGRRAPSTTPSRRSCRPARWRGRSISGSGSQVCSRAASTGRITFAAGGPEAAATRGS